MYVGDAIVPEMESGPRGCWSNGALRNSESVRLLIESTIEHTTHTRTHEQIHTIESSRVESSRGEFGQARLDELVSE